MLNATDMEVIMRAKAALTKQDNDDAKAIVKDLDTLLLRHAQHAASVAAAASTRTKRGTRGAPALSYAIEVEPGYTQQVQGAGNAHAALAQVLQDYGERRAIPSPAGLASMLSKNGHWHTLLETDNGVVSVTVKKLGTEDAESKSRAKS